MSHVDEGTLHACLDGELPGAEGARLTAHLAECAVCRARLEEERALAHRARDLLALAAPPVPRTRPRVRPWRTLRLPLAWAATVAIAFAVGRYVEGARLPHELTAERAESLTVASPVVAAQPALPHRAPRASVPRVDDAARREVAAAPATAPARQAIAPAVPPGVGLDSVQRLLGQAPALLPGVPVLRVTRAQDGVVIEQEPEPGTVIRLYEHRASQERAASVAPSAARDARASAALNAGAPSAGEHLARYVGSLRVEITGPLPADSLSKLLDLIE